VPAAAPRRPVGELLDELGSELEGEARLAAPARPRHGEEAVRPDQPARLFELALATDERSRLDREVRPVQGLQSRKRLVAKLVQVDRRAQVLQSVLAQIRELGAVEEPLRRLGDEHLAAVACAHDPGGSMHVHADVALVGDERLARVDAHPHAHRPVRETVLGSGGRNDGIGRTGEGDEKRVTLCVHLDAAVAREGVPQHAAVLGQYVRVARSELVEQPRRALDVREQQRHRAARELPHGNMISQCAISAKMPERLLVIVAGSLLGAALVGWIVALETMRGMDAGPGTQLGSVGWFLGIWVTMTAAMMLPSTLPAATLFARLRGGVGTVGFVLGYVAAWTGFGLVSYAGYRGLRASAPAFAAWDARGPLIAGAALAAAGIYQWTPLKRACLRHCRSPLHFLLRGGRGNAGALRAGIGHGLYCLGCCAGLMLILFALGVMSLVWMGLVAAAILVEKTFPRGESFAQALAVVLVALGLWVASAPASVPGLTEPAHMEMRR
jgi:predicted metal-binding membrane protein